MGGPNRILETVGVLRRELAAFEPGCCSALDCATLAETLTAIGNACLAAGLLAAARAADLGAHRTRGFAEPAAWFVAGAGQSTRQAKEALATAHELDACPSTKEALLAGEVSLPQAQESTRAAAESPGAEHDLLVVAKKGSLSELRDAARERRLTGTPPETLHARQVAARRFRHWRDGLGMDCFDGALPPETDIPFVTRIERLAARSNREARRAGGRERFEAHAADALVELCREGSGPKRDRAELVIVCDRRAWARGHAHEGERCHLVGGGPVPVPVARELGEDAFVKAVVHDGVKIETVRHFGPYRYLKAELKTALDLGAGPDFSGRACVDCGRRYGLENDHVDPVGHTGPTAYDNLAPRCWPHHREKTERDRKAGLLRPKGKRRAPPTPVGALAGKAPP